MKTPSGGDDEDDLSIYDAVYHDPRVLERMSALLGDELVTFNYKMM